MSFQPVVLSGGLAGWLALSRSVDVQQIAHSQGPAIVRSVTEFRDALPKLTTAESLVDDPATLTVVLGAYGLQDDLANKFFIRKIMEDGTSSTDALANRLADPRYAQLAADFDFSDGPPKYLSDPNFLDSLQSRYERQQFEVAVGQQDVSMRLSLSLERELSTLVERVKGEDAQWFAVMGSSPLRRVFETALGLPQETAAIDIDRQLTMFRDRAEARFGYETPAAFLENGGLEELRRAYLVSVGSEAAPSSPALMLLTGRSTSQSILSALYRF